jgi:cell wall assembly regulator SMI1
MTQASIHQSFVSEFHQGEPRVPATALDIDRAERELATVLPKSYITFMQTQGAVQTPSLLSLIVDGEHQQWDVMAISEITELIEGTKGYWSAGMSEKLVGFATDSMGNLFCFRRVAPETPRAEDAEVLFFDHEFCSDSKVADSFDEWLLSYLKLKKDYLAG